MAWMAAVGADSIRTSGVRFGAFEQSWVSEERAADAGDECCLTSVAVMAVEGDADMGARLAHVLRAETALRVVVHEAAGFDETELDRATAARRLAESLSVDAVLFGNVAAAESHPSDWGWKTEESRRLFLYLLARDGRLLWKDELPFTIVKGAKPPLEEAVQSTLALRLMDHVRDLGLDDLGYLPKRVS